MTITIKNNLLFENDKQVKFKVTPNKSGNIQLKYICVHWTGNDSFNGAISWLTNPSAKASAQIILGRNPGEICQLSGLLEKCWHVGESEYNNLKSLNGYSIGIECVGSGLLKTLNGKFYNSLKKEIAPDDVVKLSDGKFYQKLTDVQKDNLYKICSAIISTYPNAVIEIVSHRELAMPRGRKSDCPDDWFNRVEINKLRNKT